jgi:hypothetical protein
MWYPNISQYKQTVQYTDSFNTLSDDIKTLMIRFDPVFASVNFSGVFKMQGKDKLYTLKCFLKEIPEMRKTKTNSYIH